MAPLPFTPDQFFDVFGVYNTEMWGGALALWLVTVATIALAIANRGRRDRLLIGLLALHWAWAGVVYHAAFFTRINRAAWLFAAAFLIQAGLFVWFGIVRSAIRFSLEPSLRHGIAAALVVYALAYPFINLAQGLEYPRVPTFGVPCPTTILTVGLLLTVSPLASTLALIPLLWSAVGGSAAFVLGVRADLVLLASGALLLVSQLRDRWARV